MMKNSVTQASTVHDFIIRVNSIQFDFSGYCWYEDDDFETKEDWEKYKEDLTSKYQNFSVYFEGYDLPEEDEDETIEGNEDLMGCEEGYYYRKLENWIDENICWCLLDLDYEVEKVSV